MVFFASQEKRKQAAKINVARIDQLESQNDSLIKGLAFVGKIVIKHDSIVADRQWKRDRAGRRGETLGALINVLRNK